MNKELKEQAHKDFDEISERQIFTLNGKKGTLKNTIIYESLISLIDSLIDKTVQMTEDRIVGIIENARDKNELIDGGNYHNCYYEEIKYLITNKSDINN